MTKTCSRCGTTKDVAEFFRAAATDDGYTAQCQACVLELQAERAKPAQATFDGP